MFYRSKLACRLAILLALVLALCGTLPALAQSGAPQSQQPTGRPRHADDAPPARQSQQSPSPTPTPRDNTTVLQDDEVVRVETDLTNVLFTAADRYKHFITNLRQEDIRITEDGVPQQIFTFQRETDRPLSLAILIDTSLSQERTLPDEKSAARAFVDAVLRPIKDEASVVSFTGDATLEQGLTGSVERVRRAIDRVELSMPTGYIGNGQVVVGTPPIADPSQATAGSTAIWDAIDATSREVLSEASDKTRRAIILVTDGDDTSSHLQMKDAINSAIKSDAVIYSIGIGDSYNYSGVKEGTLRRLSEKTGGRAFFPKNEADLRAAFDQIQLELRSQYLVAYSPTNKTRDGSYRQVRIDIVNPELRKLNLRLTYRQGYFAKSPGGTAAVSTPTRKQ